LKKDYKLYNFGGKEWEGLYGNWNNKDNILIDTILSIMKKSPNY
jgi:hypothetical protein